LIKSHIEVETKLLEIGLEWRKRRIIFQWLLDLCPIWEEFFALEAYISCFPLTKVRIGLFLLGVDLVPSIYPRLLFFFVLENVSIPFFPDSP
jgi:hypothetical protein